MKHHTLCMHGHTLCLLFPLVQFAYVPLLMNRKRYIHRRYGSDGLPLDRFESSVADACSGSIEVDKFPVTLRISPSIHLSHSPSRPPSHLTYVLQLPDTRLTPTRFVRSLWLPRVAPAWLCLVTCHLQIETLVALPVYSAGLSRAQSGFGGGDRHGPK